jgi:hypothetical protein
VNTIPDGLKLYAIVSAPALKKMGGNRGKLGAMLGHAYLHAMWDADDRHPDRARAYKHSGLAKKVVLVCDDEDLMRQLAADYQAVCGTTVVEDAGLTVFNGEKTFAAVGIGPLAPEERDARLAGLKVLI